MPDHTTSTRASRSAAESQAPHGRAASRGRRQKVFSLLGKYSLLLVIAALWFFFGAMNQRFASSSNAVNILVQTAPLLLAALGQTFAIIVGGLDISIASNVALSSVVSALVTRSYGPAVGVAAGVATGALVGLVNGFLIGRFKLQPVIVTIAMLTFARGLAFQLTSGIPVTGLPRSYFNLAWGKMAGVPIPIWIAGGALLVVIVMLGRTPFGTKLYALGSNEEAARLVGMRTVLIKTAAYVIGGALAGLAAVIYTAQASSGQPTLANGLELQTIAAAVIGGAAIGGGSGSAMGTLLGTLVIAILGNGMNIAGVTPYVQQVVLGLAIILAVVWDRLQRTLSQKLSGVLLRQHRT